MPFAIKTNLAGNEKLFKCVAAARHLHKCQDGKRSGDPVTGEGQPMVN